MLDICEPLFFEECLIVGVTTKVFHRNVALGTIDRVTNDQIEECDVFDLN